MKKRRRVSKLHIHQKKQAKARRKAARQNRGARP